MRDFVSYFEAQWLKERPEWAFGHSGEHTPTTNNGAELAVKHHRINAGGVCGNVGATVAWMLKEVEFVSKEVFDVAAERTC